LTSKGEPGDVVLLVGDKRAIIYEFHGAWDVKHILFKKGKFK
tara:strand:- start:714 stop:839 length:126 start_codon:yes stop_codon:yes gene_type:complete